MVRLTCADNALAYTYHGISSCGGAEGAISQEYYYQSATEANNGKGYLAYYDANHSIKLDYVTDNYIVLDIVDTNTNWHISVECYS